MKDIYKKIGIYRITNTVDGKSYIGKTGMNFGDRWDSHRAMLNAGKHANSNLQQAWTEYGKECFEFEIIECVDNPERLNALEIEYINQYRENGLCYNISDGGDTPPNFGKHLSEETKKKIGQKNRINMLGRAASDETKKKMSVSQKKRYENWTDEDRAEYGKKISQYASGYRWSDKAKAAFSKKQREQPNSAKYTADDIRSIRKKRAEGYSLKALAEEYHTSPSYISSIVHFRRWADV